MLCCSFFARYNRSAKPNKADTAKIATKKTIKIIKKAKTSDMGKSQPQIKSPIKHAEANKWLIKRVFLLIRYLNFTANHL